MSVRFSTTRSLVLATFAAVSFISVDDLPAQLLETREWIAQPLSPCAAGSYWVRSKTEKWQTPAGIVFLPVIEWMRADLTPTRRNSYYIVSAGTLPGPVTLVPGQCPVLINPSVVLWTYQPHQAHPLDLMDRQPVIPGLRVIAQRGVLLTVQAIALDGVSSGIPGITWISEAWQIEFPLPTF